MTSLMMAIYREQGSGTTKVKEQRSLLLIQCLKSTKMTTVIQLKTKTYLSVEVTHFHPLIESVDPGNEVGEEVALADNIRGPKKGINKG